MKKLFSCLLALVLLCSVFTTAFAACPKHGEGYAVPTKTEYGPWYSISDTQHRKDGIIYYYCTYCAEMLPSYNWTDPTSMTATHSFTFYDLGHAGDTKMHNWKKVCGTCGYIKNGQYSCSGNPCITIQSIPRYELQ